MVDDIARVRIRSGGTTASTSVVAVAEDGTETPLCGVLAVSWNVAVGEGGEHTFAVATVTFEGVEVDVTGSVDGG